MKPSICGADCAGCQWSAVCPGCSEEKCFIARYITANGKKKYAQLKNTLIHEINSLAIPGMPQIRELYALVGNYVNLEYPLPGGQTAKFLDDSSIYLGNQVAREDKPDSCYGLLADEKFILVSEYGPGGVQPRLVLYKRR